jgi:hypothetical protein
MSIARKVCHASPEVMARLARIMTVGASLNEAVIGFSMSSA